LVKKSACDVGIGGGGVAGGAPPPLKIAENHMVFHATEDDGLAIEIGQDAAEVAVQFFAEQFVAKKRATVFG